MQREKKRPCISIGLGKAAFAIRWPVLHPLLAFWLTFLLIFVPPLFFSGCAVKGEEAAPRVLTVLPGDCGTPTRPVLQHIDGGQSFNSPANVLAFMENSDFLKEYAVSLESVLACFQAQRQKHPVSQGAGHGE